jgi:protein gp37
MSDLFHERLTDEEIAAVFGVMAACPQHTFQVLTKRPARARAWFEWVSTVENNPHPEAGPCAACFTETLRTLMAFGTMPRNGFGSASAWPLPNVWLGVSVEDQASADERIPLLLQCPAARFVSYEPALGPVDFRSYLERSSAPPHHEAVYGILTTGGQWINWIIVGGESGPGARPFDVAWARETVRQCREAEVACFVKQLGARPYELPAGTGQRYDLDTPLGMQGACAELEYLLKGTRKWKLRDRKGGDWSEWPEDLRVREFPPGASADG